MDCIFLWLTTLFGFFTIWCDSISADVYFQGLKANQDSCSESDILLCAGHPNQSPSSPSMTSEKQEAANSNVKSSEQVSPSQPSKMVTPDVPSKWIEVYEDGWYSVTL